MKIEETLYAFAVRLGTGEPAYEARLLARDEEDAVRLAREAALQSWRGVLVPAGVANEPDPSLLANLSISEEPHMGSGTRRILPPMSAVIGRFAGEHKDAGKAYRTPQPHLTPLAKGRAERTLGLCAELAALEWGWGRGAEDYVLSISAAIEANGPTLCDTLTLSARAEYEGGSSISEVRMTGRILRAAAAIGARLNGASHFRNVQRRVWARNAPPASASGRAAWATMSAARAGQSAQDIAAFLREAGDPETAAEFEGV